jgi:hypothetical protein
VTPEIVTALVAVIVTYATAVWPVGMISRCFSASTETADGFDVLCCAETEPLRATVTEPTARPVAAGSAIEIPAVVDPPPTSEAG